MNEFGQLSITGCDLTGWGASESKSRGGKYDLSGSPMDAPFEDPTRLRSLRRPRGNDALEILPGTQLAACSNFRRSPSPGPSQPLPCDRRGHLYGGKAWPLLLSSGVARREVPSGEKTRC